jgi:hypothetical protein
MNRVIYFFILLGLLASCGIKKENIKNLKAKPKSAEALIHKIELGNKMPEWLSIKGKINIEKEGKSIKLSSNIRIRKDSAIWVSVTAPFGIELFRAMIRPDSVFFINIPKANYTKQPISYLHKQLKTEIDFFQIQEMFFGTPSVPKANYNLTENKNSYTISAKEKNKKAIIFTVEKENFRIIEGNYKTSENEYFKFTLSQYSETEERFFLPNNIILNVKATDDFNVDLNYSKIIVNKAQKMTFSIPKNYVELQ